MRAHLAEALGVFAIVFFGCGAVAVAHLGLPGVALAFGLVVAAMIYALGSVSGAHLNPAVSVAFAMTGAFSWRRVATYSAAQVVGATLGALALRATLGDASLGVTHPSGSDLQSFAWEVALTLTLVLVILTVAAERRETAAVAIGGAVTLGVLVGGPISGASMNPARSLGPALVSGDLTSIWIYLVAPVAGAIVASLVYACLHARR